MNRAKKNQDISTQAPQHKNIRTNQRFLFFYILLFASTATFAYEWPQDASIPEPFHSFFGQSRCYTFSSSLIFSEPQTVTSVDSGRLLVKINSTPSDMGWFESPLGNAVIITHEEQMLTVYANLEEVWLPENTTLIERGDKIGVSGASGWQQGKSCLELQILDTKNQTAINPLILMPRLESQSKVTLTHFSAMNKQGELFDLSQRKSLPNGIYTFYANSATKTMPYKTTVSINGAENETITYDVLRQINNRLCVTGKKTYSFNTIYPDGSHLLLAEVILTKGRNTVTVTASNILGEETTSSFTLDIH